MVDEPFSAVCIVRDEGAAPTASGYCNICREDRALHVTEYTEAMALTCPICKARTYFAGPGGENG